MIKVTVIPKTLEVIVTVDGVVYVPVPPKITFSESLSPIHQQAAYEIVPVIARWREAFTMQDFNLRLNMPFFPTLHATLIAENSELDDKVVVDAYEFIVYEIVRQYHLTDSAA